MTLDVAFWMKTTVEQLSCRWPKPKMVNVSWLPAWTVVFDFSTNKMDSFWQSKFQSKGIDWSAGKQIIHSEFRHCRYRGHVASKYRLDCGFNQDDSVVMCASEDGKVR